MVEFRIASEHPRTEDTLALGGNGIFQSFMEKKEQQQQKKELPDCFECCGRCTISYVTSRAADEMRFFLRLFTAFG